MILDDDITESLGNVRLEQSRDMKLHFPTIHIGWHMYRVYIFLRGSYHPLCVSGVFRSSCIRLHVTYRVMSACSL